MAHGTRVHERGGKGGEVTITLPGPPVAYAVEPARLVAWLVGRGYALTTRRPDEPTWLVYQNQERRFVLLPNPSEWEAGEYAVALAESVGEAAETAGMAARDLAAQLGPEGPALQWAHASADTRRQAIDDIAGFAVSLRGSAERSRSHGRPADALAHEGRAMGLEAAAAVLRGGGR